MLNEVKWQTKFIKRIRTEGGYARKWATQYTVGVPDLIAVLRHEFESQCHFFEVKLEKNWFKNTNRTIDVSAKQLFELRSLQDAGANVAVVLIAHIFEGNDPVICVVRRQTWRDKPVINRSSLLNSMRYSDISNLTKVLIA